MLGSATLSACIAFLIGRRLARERIMRLVARDERLKALHRAVGAEGWRVVGLMRLSPVFPFGLQNYLFGVTAVRLVPYALATLVGMAPATTLYVYVGSLGSAGTAAGEAGALRWALVAAGLAATAAVVWLVTRRAHRARAAAARRGRGRCAAPLSRDREAASDRVSERTRPSGRVPTTGRTA